MQQPGQGEGGANQHSALASRKAKGESRKGKTTLATRSALTRDFGFSRGHAQSFLILSPFAFRLSPSPPEGAPPPPGPCSGCSSTSTAPGNGVSALPPRG